MYRGSQTPKGCTSQVIYSFRDRRVGSLVLGPYGVLMLSLSLVVILGWIFGAFPPTLLRPRSFYRWPHRLIFLMLSGAGFIRTSAPPNWRLICPSATPCPLLHRDLHRSRNSSSVRYSAPERNRTGGLNLAFVFVWGAECSARPKLHRGNIQRNPTFSKYIPI